MDKATVLAQMTASGELHTNRRTPAWEEAFKLYVAATKDNVNPRCGSCFNKVKKWLQS